MLHVFGKDAELYTNTGIDPLIVAAAIWFSSFLYVQLYRGKEYRETTPAVQTESSVPVSQPVRLGYFTSLSHLEISYIPIQSIQDLLKMRERLETLVVTNCFSTNFRLQVLIVYTCLHMCLCVCVRVHTCVCVCVCVCVTVRMCEFVLYAWFISVCMSVVDCWSLLNSAIHHSGADSLHSCCLILNEWL